MYAAIAAARRGASVIVLDRGYPGRSGNTVIGAYSVCAALGYADSRDNAEVHYRDTINAGQGINNAAMTWAYATEAPERVLEIESFGARFDRSNGRLAQDMMPGHTYPRAVHAQRRSGQAMMVALQAEIRRRNIGIMGDVVALDIVLVDGAVAGVVAYRLADNEYVFLPAGSVVLATGGAGQIYASNTNATENTGDGMAMAYRAGAEMVDMEFVQFYPLAQCYPRLTGMGATATHALRLRGLKPRLYNGLGEDFMDRAMPDWHFKATRDVLARAVYREVIEGRGSPHGGVFISVSHHPSELVEKEFKFDSYLEKMLKLGLDIRKDPLETTVSCHYFMGGVRTDDWCRSSVPGLFAAGEVAGGNDGANRLGGNALSFILVFGRRAGIAAAEYARGGALDCGRATKAANSAKSRWRGLLSGSCGARPYEIKDRIRSEMWTEGAVLRKDAGLKKAIAALEEVEESLSRGFALGETRYPYDREVQDAIDAHNMALVSDLVTRAALVRTESRGGHFREDYPKQDDANWLVNLVIVPGPKPRIEKANLVGRDEGRLRP